MTITTWHSSLPKFSKLDRNIETDILIIGGGLAGMWTAYLLSKEGKRVTLVEKNRLGRGTTMYTTAFLAQEIDTDLSDLADMFGEKVGKAIWESHAEAIDAIEETANIEKIDCDFKRLSLFDYAETKEEASYLEEETILAKKLGFNVLFKRKTNFGFPTKGSMEIKNQAVYHPIKFYEGLLNAATLNGIEIHENTEVGKIKGKGPFIVETTVGKTIRANKVVIATYQPLNNKSTHFKKGMYTSYVFELSIPRNVIKEGMYIDQKNPYHYVRVEEGERSDRMIVGGEDHRAELDSVLKNKSFKALKEYVEKTFPNLPYKLDKKWSGKILEPSDGLALIGEISPGQFVASAFSGNGMTFSVIAGKIITDKIMDRQNRFAKIYEADRDMSNRALAKKTKDYGEEFAKGALKNIFK